MRKNILIGMMMLIFGCVFQWGYVWAQPRNLKIHAQQTTYVTKCKTITKKSGKYYGYENGKLMKNRFTIVNDSYYYFTSNGTALTNGWKTINGFDYYFGSNGKAYTGAKKVGSSIYGFSSSGKLLKNGGYKKIDGKYYYFNSKGKSTTGLKKAGEYKRYFNGDGTVAKAQFKKIDGKTYYFTKDGILNTSSLRNIRNDLGLKHSKWISSDQNGVVRKGLHELTIDGETNVYYFDKDLERGVKIGLHTINGEIYYFKSNGKAAKGLYTVGKYKYYFDKDGTARRSQWVEVNKKRYYMASNGRSYIDTVKKVGQYTYYFTPSGYVHTGYKVIESNTGTQYYYFNSKGRSRTALLQIPNREYYRYFNGDGSVATSEFKTINGKTYFFTAEGITCHDEWRNIKTDLNLAESKYIVTDPITGEVQQGYTTVTRNGSIYTYYMDLNEPIGFRTGIQDCGELGTYYFQIEHGNQGHLAYGFVSDTVNKKLYYCDLVSGKVIKDTTYMIPGTNAIFGIDKDGVVEINVNINENDNELTRLMKVAMSQMFKSYGHYSISEMKGMELDEIDAYSCSGFVLRMLYELSKPNEYFVSNHDIAYDVYKLIQNGDTTKYLYSSQYDRNLLKTGDFVFINKDDCYTSEDDRGLPLIIDLDEDGVCDREHETIIGVDGKSIDLHVHHVGIYIGNGFYINAMPRKGIIISRIPEDETYEYVSAYARIF